MIKKQTKTFIRIIPLILMVVFVFSITAFALPKASTDFFVADYAKVLQEDTANFIQGVNIKYSKQKEKPQLVVLTVKDLEGLDITSYATQVFEKWKIGNKDYDNGVLVVFALDERRIEVKVGYGLEGVLPDGKVGRILDMNTDSLSQGDYDNGLKGIFYALSHEINEEYQYEGLLDEYTDIKNLVPGPATSSSADSNDMGLGEIVFVIILLIFIIFSNRGGRGRRRGGFYGGGGFGSGGGGFGGGGGFSGGGGRSGGGGAGRGF